MLNGFLRSLAFGSMVLVVACGGKPSPAEHIRKGASYAAAGQFQEAILELRIALQADPKSGEARLKLGDAYMHLDNLKAALGEYARAADLMPGSLEAQLKAGNMLVTARSFEDAKARADRAIAIDAKSVDAQILRGNALAGLKDLEGAMADYAQAIALDSSAATVYNNLGTIQLSKGDREEAEATFRKAVESAPNSVPARLALANFLWATGRGAESEQTLKDVLDREPNNAVANRALGMLYLSTGRAADAERFFAKISSGGTTTAASLALADYYIVVRRFDAARKALEGAAVNASAFSAATVRLASVDVMQGLRSEAKMRLHEVLIKEPANASALLLRARLLLAESKRDDALADVKSVTTNETAPAVVAQAYSIAGDIHSVSDRIDDAIAAYEQVLKLQPRPLDATLALARLHFARHNIDKTATYAQLALAIQPGNAEAQSLLVRSHLLVGDVALAKRELAPLNKAFPTSPTVANLNALVMLADHKVDAARAWYNKAWQLTPGDYETLAGLVNLDLATGHKQEATARIEERLRGRKPPVEMLLLAARTYGATGQAEKAEPVLRQAIEDDPSRLQAYALLGQMYIGQGRLADAEGQFRALLRNNPKSVSANTMLGLLLEARGKATEAEQEYQRVLGVDPRAAVAANNLAWMYVAGGRNLDEALRLAQVAYQGLSQDPDVNDTLGWILYQKKMGSAALPYLEMSLRARPDEPGYQYHAGLAYVETGDWDKARPALKQALRMRPDDSNATAAAKALTLIGD